jgi:KDO2-lipid IV(A) lauroyltransferase
MEKLINYSAKKILFIIGFFIWIWPRKIQWWIATFIAILWWDILKLRRFTVFRNLSIVFPEKTKVEKIHLARLSLKHMCMALPEFFCLPFLHYSKSIGSGIKIYGQEHYENAIKQGRGVLLLSLHIGNGDMGVAGMALAKIPVHLISKKFKNKFLSALWFGVREELGVRFIDPHGSKTAFEILSATKKNEAVVFVIDQFMGRPFGIPTTFFKRPTGTAYGLALFAAKTLAPVIPVYTFRDEQLNTCLRFEPEVLFLKNENRDLQNQIMTQKYNSVLETLILRHPEQWMWVHRRWKRYE